MEKKGSDPIVTIHSLYQVLRIVVSSNLYVNAAILTPDTPQIIQNSCSLHQLHLTKTVLVNIYSQHHHPGFGLITTAACVQCQYQFWLNLNDTETT